MASIRNCFILLVIFSLASSSLSFAQTTGDYRSNVATGNWNVAGSWQTFNGTIWVAAGAAPTGTETLITIRAGHNITMPHVGGPLNPAFAISGQLDIQATGILTIATFTVPPFTKLTLTGTINNSGTINITGTGAVYVGLSVNSGGVINNSGSIGTTPAGNANKIRFNSGSTYNHIFTASAGTIPTATWDASSLCSILSSNDLAPLGLNQTFGSFEWNNTTQTVPVDLAGALTNVQGDLLLTSNSFAGLSLNGGGSPYNLSIGGSLVCNEFFELNTGSSTTTISIIGNLITDDPLNFFSSYLVLVNGTGSTILNISGNLELRDNSGSGFSAIDMSLGSSGSSTVNLSGNLIIDGSTLFSDSFGSGAYSLNFNGSNQSVTSTTAIDGAINVTVTNNSTLTIPAGPGDNFLGSGGIFVLESGTTARVASAAAGGAIQVGTSAGSLRFLTKQFDSGSTIEYNGASQFIGNGHPSAGGVNTIINNSSGNTTLASDVTIGGNLILTTGNISVSSQTLTLNGNLTPNANSIAVTSNSSLSIGGTGAFGTLVTSGSSSINNFTVNRSTTGSVTLGSDLTISGTLTQTLGDIILNGRTLTLNGPYVRTNGSFSVDASSSFIVGGAGALPAAVTFAGAQALNTLTINRAAATFPTNSTLSVTNLNLLAGTFSNTGTITIATSGVITRTEGSIINNTPQAQSSYDIVYNIANDISSGAEIPSLSSQLRNVTKTGGAALTLSEDVTINGNLTLSNGSFNASTHTIDLKGNFIANSTSILTSSPFVFSGNTSISGGALVQFGQVTITGSLTPAINIRIDGNLINDGTLNAGSGTTTFGGTTTISGGSTHNFNNLNVTGTLTAPATMNVAGNFGSTGTFNAGSGLVVFNGSTSITGNPTFNDITVSGALTSPATLNLRGHLRINGTFNANSGTVAFVGTANQRIDRTLGVASTIDFFNITVNKTSGTFNVFSTVPNTIFRVQNNFTISQNGASTPDVDFDGPSNNGTLILRSTASRTAKVTAVPSGVTVVGLLTAERYIDNTNTTRAWRYFASPLIGATVADWQGEIQITGQFSNPSSGTGSNNPSLYRWTETNGGLASNRWGVWPNNVAQPASAFPITNGRGYSLFVRNTGTPTMDVRGTLATGNINIGLTRTGTEVDAAGYNLVGNPYPAPIDWDLVTLPGGVSSTISMLDEVENAGLGAGTFVYYVQGGPAFGNFDGVIASSQAFWVELATGSSATLTLMESHKVSDINPIVVKERSIANMLRINLQGVDSKDETIVYFNDEATQAVDLKFDASKKINDKINLYTIFDSAPQQRFAINGVKQVGCSSSFRLGINDWDSNGLPVTPSGNYKFNFSEMESFTSSESFLLKDNFTGVTIDLMTSPTYDFEVSSNPNSYGDLRFELLVINNAPDPSLTVTPLVSEPSCKAGSVTLIVDGAPVGGSYKWYDSKDSPLAIQGETSSEFITPALEKSKTYFVESLNAEGCRSNRIPVVAEVVNFDDAVITENESTLTSNYTAGNQWYRDGVLITGANEQVFKPEESGLYKVEVSIGSCKTLAERSFTVTGLEDDTFFKDFVQIYPNPVSKDLTIKIRHEISGTPRIINLNGGEIGVFELKKQDDGLIGVYNFEGKAAGVYLLQIADKKGKIFYKRVIKK